MKELILKVLKESSEVNLKETLDEILKNFKKRIPVVTISYRIKNANQSTYPKVIFTLENFSDGRNDGVSSNKVMRDFVNYATSIHTPYQGSHPVKFYSEFEISKNIIQNFLNSDYIRKKESLLKKYNLKAEDFFEDFDGSLSPKLEKLSDNVENESNVEEIIKEYIEKLTDVPLKFEFKYSKNREGLFINIYPQLTLEEFLSCKYKTWNFDDQPLYTNGINPILNGLQTLLKQKQKNNYDLALGYEIVWPREIGNFILEQNNKIRQKLDEKTQQNISVVINYGVCGKSPDFIIGYNPNLGLFNLKDKIDEVILQLEKTFPEMKSWKTSNRFWDVRKMFSDSDSKYWSQDRLFDYFLDTSRKIFGDIYDYDKNKFKDLETNTKVFCKQHQNWFDVIPYEHLKGKRCPFDNESKGEKLVRVFLEKKGIQFKTYHRIKECFSELNGKCYTLPFDFFLPDFNLLIEYDGEQHYKPIEMWGGEEGFRRRKILDEIKNKFAKDNNLQLIRIPYTVKKEDELIKYLPQNLLRLK